MDHHIPENLQTKPTKESNGTAGSPEKIRDKFDSTGKVSSSGKPVGAVESGVLIRKTSIRRRLSTESGDSDAIAYGNKTREYIRLRKEITSGPTVTNALEGLRERWKMLMFMYEDCLDMIQERKDRESQIRKCRARRELFASCIIYTCIAMPLTLFMLVLILILL